MSDINGKVQSHIREKEARLGKIAYDAYCEAIEKKGDPPYPVMALFCDLPELVQEAWITAADAILRETIEEFM